MKRYFLQVAVIIFAIHVSAQSTTYKTEIDNWHNKRVADLKVPTGWVNLAGLFWLKPGRNSFGSAPGNDIVFRNPDMPALAGYFDWADDQVSWVSAQGIQVTQKDSAITSEIIFRKGNFRPPLLSLSHFRWNIIQRDDKVGVRFRDLESAAVKNFKGIDRYPVDSSWRFTAYLEAPATSTLAITNVLGQTNSLPTPGKLVFTIGKTTYRLDALEEGPELFIIFGDATSGKETYPAGRFVYVKKPEPGGTTVIDFNKAYNPPCAFSQYATCPLPPKQNILPIAIKAGEKNYEEK